MIYVLISMISISSASGITHFATANLISAHASLAACEAEKERELYYSIAPKVLDAEYQCLATTEVK